MGAGECQVRMTRQGGTILASDTGLMYTCLCWRLGPDAAHECCRKVHTTWVHSAIYNQLHPERPTPRNQAVQPAASRAPTHQPVHLAAHAEVDVGQAQAAGHGAEVRALLRWHLRVKGGEGVGITCLR